MSAENIFDRVEKDERTATSSTPAVVLARQILGAEASPEQVSELTDTRPPEHVQAAGAATDRTVSSNGEVAFGD